jgi:ectoine hydroxylase-related dioxygenase (phytanoyl-CoA dioxygenase family)
MNTKLLSEQEIQSYDQNGYLIYKKQVFTPDKLTRLTNIFEEHLAEKGSKLSDELDTPHFRDPRLLDFLLDDQVLDLVEPITGPNIMLWSSHFLSKDPYTGRATPWHEDSAYWKGRLDNYEKIVTVWLAIDPSNRGNGCMGVLPGTHANGFSEYEDVDASRNTFAKQIKNLDKSNAVYFELEKGQCSLHNSKIIHGADANTSPYRRCGYTMRYMPTSTKVNREKMPDFKIWLARGKDLAGNTYANQ